MYAKLQQTINKRLPTYLFIVANFSPVNLHSFTNNVNKNGFMPRLYYYSYLFPSRTKNMQQIYRFTMNGNVRLVASNVLAGKHASVWQTIYTQSWYYTGLINIRCVAFCIIILFWCEFYRLMILIKMYSVVF